jgi:hypothetical protein
VCIPIRTRTCAPWGHGCEAIARCASTAAERVSGTREDHEERIALRVDLVSSVPFEGLSQDALMVGQGLAVALAELAFESRRAFYVREQERYRGATEGRGRRGRRAKERARPHRSRPPRAPGDRPPRDLPPMRFRRT